MNVTGIGGSNTGVQQGMDNNMQTDAVSKNIQNQITNAQKKLQELSANKELSLEEKMKKRQEIQQEIAELNLQLRQHQLEQRREKQQKAASMDDMSGGVQKAAARKEDAQDTQIVSQATMSSLISADSSMKQAKSQGAVAVKLKGKAGALEGEIRMDKGRGGNTQSKEAELAELQERMQNAATSQISTLAKADKNIEEAAKAERTEADQPEETIRESVDDVTVTQEESRSAAHVSVDIRL